MGKTRGWEEISEILTKAARDICGVQSKKVENPWIAGHEEQLQEMRTEINKWIAARNRAMTNSNQITKRIFQRHLSKARRQMKRTLKHLERDWWDERLKECEEASRIGDFGAMYSTLRTLGTRSSKPQGGTNITTEQFRSHFAKVSAVRFENEPAALEEAIEETPDRRHEIPIQRANEELNKTPSDDEILEAINEAKDSAPGKDKVRIRYVKEACAELRVNVVLLVQRLFETRANTWEDLVKVGQIVPLFKKGDRDEWRMPPSHDKPHSCQSPS